MLEFKHIKTSEIKGDLNKLSKDELFAKNSQLIDEYRTKAKNQLEQYMNEHNVLNDSDRILKKFTVVNISRKYVIVDEV
jgi:hypothetical protein